MHFNSRNKNKSTQEAEKNKCIGPNTANNNDRQLKIFRSAFAGERCTTK